MFAFIPIIGKIIDALVSGGQMKAEEADKARAALADAQVQSDKTFAEFMRLTTPDPASLIGSYVNAITVIIRQAIVVAFAAAILFPVWGATLSLNLKQMPWQYWLIIGWEFYGNQALKLIPWFKNGGNGNGKGQVYTPASLGGTDISTGPRDSSGIQRGDTHP